MPTKIPYRTTFLLPLLLLLAACVPPNNVPLGPNVDPAPLMSNRLEVETVRAGAFILKDEQREALTVSPERAILAPGQGVAVDADGRAILYFNDLLNVELLQGVELLQVQQQLSGDNPNTTLFQNGGTLLVTLTQPPDLPLHRLIIQTAFARVEAAGNSRFAVVREPGSPLEWVVGLEVGEGASLQIVANELAEPVAGGQARWVTSLDGPGPVMPLPPEANGWLEGAQAGTLQPSLGQTLWPPADLITDTGPLVTLPGPGQPFQVGANTPVSLTLDPEGLFGSPTYILEDCNGDGLRDIALQKGVLLLDFRQLLSRVTGVDVTIFNRSGPENGALQGLDPAGARISWQPLEAMAGETETLSLRSAAPYHYAELRVLDACFLGFSLTPPRVSGEPGEPRSLLVQTAPPAEAVVNVLQTTASTQRLPQNGQLQASAVGLGGLAGLISIDGDDRDWITLIQRTNLGPAPITAVTYDEACANRYPNTAGRTDLSGQVQLAYDEQYLYVGFRVEDDGLLPYTGADERYFLGDSPQLLLDLDLNADIDDTNLSADDIQIDLKPVAGGSQAMLWQLNTLSARPVEGASLVTTPTNTGYFLEAALPWRAMSLTPRAGDRLGIVASLSDNDTSGTDAQECIISTSPQRDWRNPTTWGTVFLRPADQ